MFNNNTTTTERRQFGEEGRAPSHMTWNLSSLLMQWPTHLLFKMFNTWIVILNTYPCTARCSHRHFEVVKAA